MSTVILCVEDEADLREVLVEELEDAGYHVEQAANGHEALERITQCPPDLVLCDVAMPVMDGYELLRCIRAHMPELSHVPFVFLTAQDSTRQIAQGKHAGADDYLVKPINFDVMLATIDARIRQVRRVQEHMRAGGAGAHPGPDGGSLWQGFARMFDLIASGVVLLGAEGDIQFTNAAAQQLLADESGSAFSKTLGRGVGNAGHRVVRAAIAAGLDGREYTEYLTLARMHGQRDLLVAVCALDSAAFPDGGPVAAVFICGATRDEPAPIRALTALFGLTPTEGRVAWAFVQGLRPEQIASTFDISVTTVAFHKRNIFQKTYTNRQADLIALLLTLPRAPAEPTGDANAVDPADPTV